MMNKLIKYELKFTNRYLYPLCLTLLIFSLVSRIIVSISGKYKAIVSSLIDMTYAIVIITFVVSTFLISIFIFYKSMATDEAYLTFALPLDIKKITFSKIISSVINNFISLICVIFSIIIRFASNDSLKKLKSEMLKSIYELSEMINVNIIFIILFIFLLYIITLFLYNIFLQTSIAIGQSFVKNKILYSFICGILIYMSTMILLITEIIVVGLFIPEKSPSYYIIIPSVFMISMLAINVTLFKLMNYMFENKLNLE